MPNDSHPSAQQEILALPELTKGELVDAPKDFWRCGTPSPRRVENSTYIRPASVNSMGGYYTARTQRVGLFKS